MHLASNKQIFRSAVLLLQVYGCVSPLLLAANPSSGSAGEAGPVFSERASQLLGIYEALPEGAPVPPGLAAPAPDLATLPLTPAAEAAVKARSGAGFAPDPKDLCQVLGPFRFMARQGVTFEILRDAPNKLVMLFDNPSWGHLRTVSLDVAHPATLARARPLWNGDSVAAWKGDTLEIDTIHFTNRTWLNDAGVANSKQLHLTEQIHLVDGGKYLQYRATATDPEVLMKPVSYTRYFRRTRNEIQEHECLVHKPVKSPAGG